jgi:hypothetical protein
VTNLNPKYCPIFFGLTKLSSQLLLSRFCNLSYCMLWISRADVYCSELWGKGKQILLFHVFSWTLFFKQTLTLTPSLKLNVTCEFTTKYTSLETTRRFWVWWENEELEERQSCEPASWHARWASKALAVASWAKLAACVLPLSCKLSNLRWDTLYHSLLS